MAIPYGIKLIPGRARRHFGTTIALTSRWLLVGQADTVAVSGVEQRWDEMHNHNWVCLSCRLSTRRPPAAPTPISPKPTDLIHS